jgi:hypothetical protein
MALRQDPPRRAEAELLPDPFWAADLASLRGQDSALFWYRCQLGLTLLAALFGAFPAHRVGSVDIVPVLSVSCFLGAGCFALALHRRDPQEQWYGGRAAAESLKTLTWKYTVRARPFTGPTDLAERRFRTAVRDVLPGSPDAAGPEPVTEPMRDARAAPLRERRRLYLNDRVYAQRTWYLSRADECDHKANVWGLWIAALFLVGSAVAVLEAEEFPSLRALGLFSAGAASVTAWTQLKQFRPLASAYRLAAADLDRIAARLTRLDPSAEAAEAIWSELAADAEDAIHREHVVWRARSRHRV